MREIEAERTDKAANWMKTNVPRPEEIKAMEPCLVQRLRSMLQSPPAVLSPEQSQQVDSVLKACIKRLDDMEVEGLLARFGDLSTPAQAEFLERAQRMLTRR